MATAHPALQRPAPVIFAGQEQLFSHQTNTIPFLFRHTLDRHPLFSPEKMFDLAREFANSGDSLYVDHGKVEANSPLLPPRQEAFGHAQAFQSLIAGNENVFFKMARINQRPEYQSFLAGAMDEFLQASGLPASGWDRKRTISVFLATPHRVTPFHIDGDLNFLCQVAGTKTVWVADGRDPEIVAPAEIERFCRGDHEACRYKPVALQRAWRFELTPGTGVHIPIFYPHWVENGDELSISVSINAKPAHYTPAAVYRVNSYLRQMGLRPSPPGVHPWLDRLKQQVFAWGRRLQNHH